MTTTPAGSVDPAHDNKARSAIRCWTAETAPRVSARWLARWGSAISAG